MSKLKKELEVFKECLEEVEFVELLCDAMSTAASIGDLEKVSFYNGYLSEFMESRGLLS